MRGVTPSAQPAKPPPSAPLDGAARRLTALDAAMLATFALLVAGHIISAIGGFGWVSAAVTVGLTALALLALALRRAWRPLIVRLLAFGLIAGICELFTDYSGEVVAHSLRYPPGEPMLWASPAYMPISWMAVLAQIGYLAWRLAGLTSARPIPWLAMTLTGLWGALNIPFYEGMAYHAGWWSYAPASGLAHTPYYVMLFEGLIAAALPLLLANLPRRPPRAILLRGLLLGAWIPCAALASWLLLGR